MSGSLPEYDMSSAMANSISENSSSTSGRSGRSKKGGVKKMHVHTSHQKTKSTRRSFWRGALEGFTGPLLLAVDPKPLRISVAVDQDCGLYGDRQVASLGRSMHVVAEAISGATQQVLAHRGLKTRIVAERRLDSAGKFKIFERVIAERMDHGENGKSQKRS